MAAESVVTEAPVKGRGRCPELISQNTKKKASDFTDEERAAYVAGSITALAARKHEVLEEVVCSIKDLERAIKTGEFGSLDIPRIVEQLATLAFLKFSVSARRREVMQAQLKALEMLGRYMGMFVEKYEDVGNHDLADRMREALARVAKLGEKKKKADVDA